MTSARRSAYLAARGAWRLLPSGFRRDLGRSVTPAVLGVVDQFTLARPAPPAPIDPRAPLVVAGLFRTANGIGEAARGAYRALEAAGLSPLAVDLSARLAPVDMEPDITLSSMPDDREGALILHLNAPETSAGLHFLDMRRGRRWRVIGVWAWELPTFPRRWEKAFPYISEVWTVSAFSKAALESGPRGPDVHVFANAVSPPPQIAVDRAAFDLPDDAFVFLTMADSMSSIARKNPFAAIAAHKRAFGDDAGKILVVKTRNLDRDPAAAAQLAQAVAGAPNIRLVDGSWSDARRWSLMATADALVSLHRSEGFGLTLAEAMAIAKPVVATGWSGNMDFTSEDNAYLAKFTLTPCRDPYGIYIADDAEWAEPDLDHAAALLRRLVEGPQERARKAAAAQATIASMLSDEAIGAAMARRLTRGA